MATNGSAYPLGPSTDPRVPLLIEQRPRSINYSEVTWDAVMTILRQAERGMTEYWADLTRRMLTDGHLASNVETRKLAISVAKLAIEPVTDDEIDVRGAADAQAMVDSLPISRIKKDLADGIFVGWGICEIKWEARGVWLWPKEICWQHPRRFRFGWDFKPYVYDDARALVDQKKLSEAEQRRCQELNIQGMPLEAHRWITHIPRSFPDYPTLGGVLVQAVRGWWIKAQALRYQLDGAEMAGNGRIIGKQDANADANTKNQFKENLQNWGASGVMMCTPEASVEFVAPLAQGTASVWSTLISECNSEMSKAVLGSTLAVEAGPTGSRAQAETQKSATIDPRAEVDDDEIRHTLHRDLVDVFLELNRINYGGRKPNVRTRSVWVEEDATIDELAVKTGLIKANQFLSSRGLPPLDGAAGDAFVKLPDMAPAFGAPVPGASADLPTAADGTKVEAVADTALNGAQVTSLAELLTAVGAGTLAPEAAVLFIVSSFPSIPQERAQAMVNAQKAMAPPPVDPNAGASAAATAKGPEVVRGSKWRDTVDDHAITVSAVGGGYVYFTDADFEDPKLGKQPNRQHRYTEATFLERMMPEVTEEPAQPNAPGGAPAGSPLRQGPSDGGAGTSGPVLSSEAHGDLYALSEDAQANALALIGHPGLLTAQAMLDGVAVFGKMRDSLIEATGRASSVATLASVLAGWQKRKNPALADQLYEVGLHGRMAGALFVATQEVPEAFEKKLALADPPPVPAFLSLPFDEAIAAFERRQIVTPEEFDAMDEAARAESFTAVRLAHETLVTRARNLLLSTLQNGGTFDDFRTALTEDEHVLGCTPSAPWYLETVFRSNVQASYGAGRLQLLTSPAVMAVRPYVERRTARDDRVRHTHAALEGALFRTDDPDLAGVSPPYLGGAFQFNCRCVLVSRRAEDVDASQVMAASDVSAPED